MTFAQAFERLQMHEGGYTDARADPGNWTGGRVGKGSLRGTHYGISAAAYPSLDIRRLTLDDAKAIYKRDYWDRAHCDEMPAAVRFHVFDFAVNSGVDTAIRYLQRIVGVADDGQWGPVSRAAAAAMDSGTLVRRLNGERLDYMTRLKNWPDAGKGWARRIARNLREVEDT